MKKYILIASAIVIVTTTVVVLTQNFSRMRGVLTGANEVPYVSTEATGDFDARINDGESSIDYTLSYSNIQGSVTQSHIHIGQKDVNGGISVWLCSNLASPPTPPGTQPCPSPSGTITGTITPANVVGPTGQLVAAGEFNELLEAIRSGNTYANVHSSLVLTGEIRAQIGPGNSPHSH